MTRVATTSPEMLRRIIAATKRNESQSGRSTFDDTFLDAGRTIVRNVSAYTIPGFGLMQIKIAATTAGQQVVDVERPFVQAGRASSVFLVNGPFEIAANGLGTAQMGPEYRLKTGSGTTYAVGTRLGWIVDSFDAGLGCLLTVIGTDDITTNIARAIADSSMIHGVCTTAIAANLGTAGEFQSTDPTVTYKAKTRKAAIAVGDELAAWPSKGEWIALKVC